MFKNISPDLVRSGRICPANLGVRSRPVRKLICPVRSSPSSWDNVLSTQYHNRLYFVTVLVIDRLRRRRSFVRMAALNTGSFLSQYLDIDFSFVYFLQLFMMIWFDEFSRYNTISSAARWKTLGNYDGLVDKLCLAALGSDFCWPSLSKFFLCQLQF